MANGDAVKTASGVASTLGGMTGKAVSAIRGRKKRLDEEEDKSSLMPEEAPAPMMKPKQDNYPWD